MNPFLFSLAAIALCACAKKPLPPAEPPVPAPSIAKEVHMPDPDESLVEVDEHSWTIFFEFDSEALREAYKAAALAKHLLHSDQVVTLSGHASEEGSPEYNLALGHKRAYAVREYLISAGVRQDRIRWMSYGEEAPVTHDPEKKHLNRRVEIALEDSK